MTEAEEQFKAMELKLVKEAKKDKKTWDKEKQQL